MSQAASARIHGCVGFWTNISGRLLATYRSEDFRQAVRVALAMAIAYYISLAMGWDRPHWAGLAVALCSLATVGDSLNKGLLRILGTFVAGSVALLLIALFPQDRWSYLLGATAYIAFCTYMVGHSSRWYFWFISGYVMPLLALAGGPEGATAFETVVLRLQQTTMGVVVFTLVAVLLWPRHAAPVLTRTVTGLVDRQRRLLADHLATLAGAPAHPEVASWRAETARTAAHLPAVVDGAELDSFMVWETRHLWRRLSHDLTVLNAAMERWRQGFAELERLDVARFMPGLPALAEELDARLRGVALMLAGERPERRPQQMTADLDPRALEGLARFDRAALVRTRDHLRRIEQLTRGLFSTMADIRGFGSSSSSVRATERPSPPWLLDPDRLGLALRSFTAVWIILLACLYVPGFPMPAGVIPVAAAASIMLALTPEVRVSSLIVPALGSIAFAGVFHIAVMPHLSSFVGLGVAIFIAIFLICSVLTQPQQAVARGLGTSMFVMVISVKNEQTYNFLFVLNFALMTQLAFAAVWISTWFPISFQPTDVIFRQLGRYWRSCERLVATQRGDGRGRGRAMRRAFDLREVTSLPGKIGRWVGAVPAAGFGKSTPAAARSLVDGMQAFGDRVAELVEVRRAPPSPALSRHLASDMATWRGGIETTLRRLAADPAAVDAAGLRAQLAAELDALEVRIEASLNAAPHGAVSDAEVDAMYRLLGAYRGVSEALVSVTERAARIDWKALGEARF